MITTAKPKKFLTQRQLIIVLVAIILLLLIYILVSQKAPGKLGAGENLTSASTQNILMQSDDLLHARLLQLQQMDREYASYVNNQESPVSLEISRLSIQQAEQALVSTIDSIEAGRKRMDDRTSSDLWKITTYFKTIVENRWFLTQVNGSGKKVDPAQQDYQESLMKMETELKNKEALIESLRSKSNVVSRKEDQEGNEAPSENQRVKKRVIQLENNETEEMVYKPAPGETMEELKQRNINLRLAFNNTATELGVLTKKYNLLKKDYDRISNQLRGSSMNR